MTRIIILAAGKGKRMGDEDLPKVLRPLCGRPMVEYVIDAARASRIDTRPILVIGHMAEHVRESCGDDCAYAVQTALLGTGDAVRAAREVSGDAESVMVLNGDMPFVSSSTIRAVSDAQKNTGAVMTMGVVKVEDFEEWRRPFVDFGRVIRDASGRVMRIVEARDASPHESEVREVNPGVFCFRAEWLWSALETLTTENAQGEYYLTDLLEKAIGDGAWVETVPIPAEEAVGINTPEQLSSAECKMIKERKTPV